MATCPVCGEAFTRAAGGGRFWANTDYQLHLQNTHPGYYGWWRKWTFIVGIAVVLVITMPLALFLPGRGGTPPLDTNPLGALVGFSVLAVSATVAGAMLPLRARSISRFRRGWRESKDQKEVVSPELSAGQGPGLELSPAMGTVPSDDSLLQTAKQLRDMFNLDATGFSPMRVEWLDYIPMPRGGKINIPLDRPMLDKQRIILPKRVHQALGLEDWRPLIASSLLVMAWQRARGKRVLASWIITTVIVYATLAGFVVSTPTLQSNPAVSGAEFILGAFGWLLGLLVMGLANSPRRHREVFDADRQVAGIMGKDAFLETLGKLENMGENLSPPTRRFDRYRAPTIKERTASLKSA